MLTAALGQTARRTAAYQLSNADNCTRQRPVEPAAYRRRRMLTAASVSHMAWRTR